MQRAEGDRHSESSEEFEVFDMREPIGTEAVGDSCDQRGIVTAGDRVGEPVRGQRAERERCEQREVGGGEWRNAGPLQRRREPAFAEPMIGKAQGAAGRYEKRSVPPLGRQRQMMCVPPQQHRAQQRIADVVRDTPEVPGNRSRKCKREERIDEEENCAACYSHESAARGIPEVGD